VGQTDDRRQTTDAVTVVEGSYSYSA